MNRFHRSDQTSAQHQAHHTNSTGTISTTGTINRQNAATMKANRRRANSGIDQGAGA